MNRLISHLLNIVTKLDSYKDYEQLLVSLFNIIFLQLNTETKVYSNIHLIIARIHISI